MTRDQTVTGNTHMVLKRIFSTALGALGLGALATVPAAFAQRIPPPDLLSEGVDVCTVELPTVADDALPMQLVIPTTGEMACADTVDDRVMELRGLWDDAATAQKALDDYVDGIDGTPNEFERQETARLTDVRDTAVEARDEEAGNSLADAVYAEKMALALLTRRNNAVTKGLESDGTVLDATESADLGTTGLLIRARTTLAEKQVDTTDDGTADTAIGAEDADSSGTLRGNLAVAQAAWDALSGTDDPYDDDGNLKDELSTTARDAARTLAAAELALREGLDDAAIEVRAVARAKSADDAAKEALKTARNAIEPLQEDLIDRLAGVGDNAASRLAEVRSDRQKAYDDAAEDLMDARDDLDDAQDDLDEAEDDLEDAQDDLPSAQAAYDDAAKALSDATDAADDDDSPGGSTITAAEQEEIDELTTTRDTAAARLSAVDDAVRMATSARKSAKTKRDAEQESVDAHQMTADGAKKKLDEALATTYEFTSVNPADALLDALVKQEDTGGALVTAVDSLHGATVANAAAIAEIGVTGSEVAANTAAIATNTADIADHETRISDNENMLMDHEGRITANETMLMDHEGRITTNEATLADHGMKLMQKKEYIDNLGMHIGVDPVTGMGTGQGGMSRIDMNEANIASNRDFIEHNHEHILEHSALIESNQMSIMRNTEDIQTLKSGVAASMALAGMPEMGARGVSVGAGSYGGETALAVGVHFSGENARFKIGVT
ncbi:MAG: YadA C-terminal domain-containing protein, partial [Gemmatimonadetes bacterium]|nr:YadA C-terminal domain-containing protein [Gemmatimonadota bacterium]